MHVFMNRARLIRYPLKILGQSRLKFQKTKFQIPNKFEIQMSKCQTTTFVNQIGIRFVLCKFNRNRPQVLISPFAVIIILRLFIELLELKALDFHTIIKSGRHLNLDL